MSSLANMKRITFSNELVMDIIDLYQFKGKDFYYANTLRNNSESIIAKTIWEDTIAFLDILGLKKGNLNRHKLIIMKNANPKNKEEQFVANLKKIFRICATNVADFDLHPNQILSTAKALMHDIKPMNFAYTEKQVQHGLISEKKRVSKREDVESLLSNYIKLKESNEYESIHLITNFLIDFLNIKPFDKDNETVGLLLVYILIFRERFTIFKYISFFKAVLKTKERFNDLLIQSNYNWKEGFSFSEPLAQYLINILIANYRELDKFIKEYEFDNKLNKSDNIENTITRLPQTFTKEEVRERHPYVSESTINRTLQRLRDEDKIRPLGTGRAARWVRIKEAPERFDFSGQIDIFSFTSEDE